MAWRWNWSAAPHRPAEIWAIFCRLAHSKSNTFIWRHGPLPISKSVDPFTHLCPHFPYPWAVENHHEHERPPHLPPQHLIVRLKSGQSGWLAASKSNTFMAPWTHSKSAPRPVHPTLLSLSIPMGSGKLSSSVNRSTQQQEH